jgi:excisionase family DNA binding protein
MNADEIERLAEATASKLAASAEFVDSLARTIAERMHFASVADWPRGKMTVDEFRAARILGISQTTLYRLRKSGRIAYTQLRGMAHYTLANLTDYLESAQSSELKRGETQG